jgi:hypothetical protein
MDVLYFLDKTLSQEKKRAKKGKDFGKTERF